jgi:alpha-tubulin suppressor-like RCC1 family protein
MYTGRMRLRFGRRQGSVTVVVATLVACGRIAFEPGTSATDADVDVGGGTSADGPRRLAAGSNHTCVRTVGGAVHCWGAGTAIGYGGTAIGDNEPASAGGRLALPAVLEVAAGTSHTCALLVDGQVRCWGYNANGQLGIGTTSEVSDVALATGVSLGALATHVVAGANHTCAILVGGSVRCWGANDQGQLGNGTTEAVGDGELPSSVNTVLSNVVELSAGGSHTCARKDQGTVVCWGVGLLLGTGSGAQTQMASNATAGDLGEPAVEISAGYAHTCARLTSGAVRCWGEGMYGQLGIGSTVTIGDDELPSENVRLGATAVDIESGGSHTCARLTTGGVRCWGDAASGQLGYGDVTQILDPTSVGDVQIGGGAIALALGMSHTCALLSDDEVVCWGLGGNGALGYGQIANIGDDETPAVAGTVPYR